MEIHFKIWLEDPAGVLFGTGRHQLLRAVQELGSLSAAAKRLEMSYRAAWGRIRASEERMGIKLLEPAGKGRRLVLTPAAQNLLGRYELFEKRADAAIEAIAQDIFSKSPDGDLIPYEPEPDR